MLTHTHTWTPTHSHTHTQGQDYPHITLTLLSLSLSLSPAGTDSGSVSGTRWLSLRNQTLGSEHWPAEGSQGGKEKEG